MAIVLTEKVGSRVRTVGENATTELHYFLTGTSDDLAVRAKVEADAPLVYDGLARRSIDFEPAWLEENDDEGLWDIVVNYGLREPLRSSVGGGGAVPVGSFSFDTSGGTQHITQSKETLFQVGKKGSGRRGQPGFKADEKAPDLDRAIGYNNDAIEGTDIPLPVYSFSETWRLPVATVTNGYKGSLFFLTGKVNEFGFKGLAAGECLFLGAAGSLRGSEDWEIVFKFAAQPNVTGHTVSDGLGRVNKKGWEYIWVQYREDDDKSAFRVVKKPSAIYVERIYDTADFAGLLIGN